MRVLSVYVWAITLRGPLHLDLHGRSLADRLGDAAARRTANGTQQWEAAEAGPAVMAVDEDGEPARGVSLAMVTVAEDFVCTRRTGGSCWIYECDDWRGDVVCEDHACLCAPGLCADGHGRCASAQKGEVLPGEFTIGSHQKHWFAKDGFEYAYLSAWGGASTTADKDEKSKWRILVNNDNTVMLQNKYYPDSYLSIRRSCESGSRRRGASYSYNCADDQSPGDIADVSFEVIRSVADVLTDTASGVGLPPRTWAGVAFKHVESGYYLDQDLRGRAACCKGSAGSWHVEPELPDRVLLDKPTPDIEKPPMPLGMQLFIFGSLLAFCFCILLPRR